MDDGSQVVAKIPNPNAGMPHFTTASEVATMDFVCRARVVASGDMIDTSQARNILETPIPRVLAWSSKAQENPIGAEYIIMERAPGIELERFWPTMSIKDKLVLVKNIAGYQNAWASISFKKFGSLYYAKDLDEAAENEPLYVDANGINITDKKFAMGPSTGRELMDNGRANISFDSGPWRTLEKYHAAIGHREMACVSQLPRLPKSPITLCGPGTYQPTREKKLRALSCYLTLIKFLLPKDEAVSSAHLWHGDLHVANIFVNPSKPTEVVGIIDWQSTETSPLYFQARQPQVIDYDGPPVHGLERPQPPNDMDKLGANAKKQAETLYVQQSLCSLYNTLIHHRTPRVYAALEFQRTPSYLLLLLARNLLSDSEATYLSQVIELEAVWDTLPRAEGSTYPLAFSTKERQEIEANVEDVERGMEMMLSIRGSIGELFPEQGIVRPERYREALDALRQMKSQVIKEFASTKQEEELWQTPWPFGA
ncbi:MAG: hypothetical protein Q9157_001907 [Trypethelium eluteriae]